MSSRTTRVYSVVAALGRGRPARDPHYDWACVRAQVVRFKTFTGTVAQDNAALQMIVLAAPGDTRVVGQFGLGLTSSAIAVQPLLDTWEHIRRFMEHEGPLFVEGDGPNEALFEMRLGRCIFFGQPFIGPGSAEHWKHPDLGAILWQVIAIPLFPLTLLYGLIRWPAFTSRASPHGRLKCWPAWAAHPCMAARWKPGAMWCRTAPQGRRTAAVERVSLGATRSS